MFIASLLRFLPGFVFAPHGLAGLVDGALIRGSDLRIPGHYHATIGSVTLAYMALTLLLLPRDGGRDLDPHRTAHRDRALTRVALLYGASASDGWRLAEAFRSAVAAQGFPGESNQPLGRISVSCGVATFPLDAQDDIALIKAADARLYRAKEAGRNCTVGPEAAGT